MKPPKTAVAPAAVEARPAEGLCSHRIGGLYCRAGEDTTRFQHGWRCPAHTPNALAGRPEPPASPGIPAYRVSP